MANSHTNHRTIASTAPTRVDLAGGTLDLWPLYLFVRPPVTLNLGIDLFAEARLEVTPPSGRESRIRLRSDDQGHELEFRWGETVSPPPQLELHYKLLRHFALERAADGKPPIDADLELSTRARSPAGAGLGGSSTLSIAMIGALATWARGRAVDVAVEGERLIEIARDVETTVIQVPAGLQDYYGAMFGGLQRLEWGAGRHRREYLPETALRGVEARLSLFYSGQSRNSGINNWELFKKFIDRQGDVQARFSRIGEAAGALDAALRASDWETAGQAIGREWEARAGLAAGISTPEIDAAFAEARRLGASSGKICGAGGGGCFFTYSSPEARTAVEQAISGKDGVRHLPFKAVPHGLRVTESAGTAE